jgi:phosphoenolpyruvate carboxylase
MNTKGNSKRLDQYDRLVKNKFNLYNSLFLNLPYSKVSDIGAMIPLLAKVCERELGNHQQPNQILKKFFEQSMDITDESKQIDFMFRVIQYVERQIVLFDSVEDAAFGEIHKLGDYLSVKDFFRKTKRQENDFTKTIDKLNNFSARIVFTAHPTQFYPPSVLEIIKRLRISIGHDDLEQVDTLLRQLGLTSLLNSKKPTPLDEAKNIIYYLRTVYYDAIPKLYGNIKRMFSGEEFDNPNIVKLGFWPGGDRDGNPFVTADITKQVSDELRMTIAKCYYNDIKTLQTQLTFKGIAEELAEVRSLLYGPMFDAKKMIPLDQIKSIMNKVKANVIEHYHKLFIDEVDNFIDKLDIFGSHFANLDIRQDHSVHLQLIEEILIADNRIEKSITELGQEQLINILCHEEIDVKDMSFSSELLEDTIANITQLREIQKNNGEAGCNRYIISNSEDINAVLFVYALFRWCGYTASEINFDIVPLFETMIGMDRSTDIMTQLFSLTSYSNHLSARSSVQTMMLGFSDGTKDGGYLKANWSIFQTKERLTKVCNDHGYEAIFFDGRGGPPARGGGKTHRFYASQGPNIANKEIQLTIQGQTITSTYGTTEQFIHNCDQLITAGISEAVQDISKDNRELIQDLATKSYKKYMALKEHDKFLDYLEKKSTLHYYKKAKIGSRPGKRGNKAKLELKDLRAISFVGSWSQLKQNVPGYFGIGTALQSYKDAGDMGDIKKLFREVPFFKALLLNSMMALTKCYFELTSYIKDDEEFSEFWQILYNEYELTKNLLLEIAGYESLMEEEPISKHSISMREKIVLPLLVIQQYALQKIADGTEHIESYEKIVVRSLYGNINASRNSA